MSTDIYYFSGTGNSLHVAKELQQRIPQVNLIPVVSLLDEIVIESLAETVGFVFPVYITSIPVPVRKFLKKLNLNSAKYIFAVATYESYPGSVNTHLEKILKKKGKSLDSYFTVKMSSNSPTGLMPSFMVIKDWESRIKEEKINDLEIDVQKKLDLIQSVICNQDKFKKDDASKNLIMEHVVPLMTQRTNAKIKFFADHDCTGCGLCEKVCLSKKIKMTDGKPDWQKDVKCYYCYACFNFCPVQSIIVRNSYTEKNGRYHHPDVAASEIAEEKGMKSIS